MVLKVYFSRKYFTFHKYLMSPKLKMYLVTGLSYVGFFLIFWSITSQLFKGEYSIWSTFTPVIVAYIMSPKPHVVKAQSGNQYGVRSIFSKKIITFR